MRLITGRSPKRRLHADGPVSVEAANGDSARYSEVAAGTGSGIRSLERACTPR
jgi:hypothetical protein